MLEFAVQHAVIFWHAFADLSFLQRINDHHLLQSDHLPRLVVQDAVNLPHAAAAQPRLDLITIIYQRQ